MTGKRVVITGGSGKAGQYIIPHLLARGHQILNLDLTPPPSSSPFAASIHTIKTDLTSSGQVFNALSSPFKLTQPLPIHSRPFSTPDAVIHLAGYARNMLVPDNETFRGNILGTYNVIEAACKLGVKKIIIASSVCVYGVTYAEGDIDFPSFPVDEEVDINPTDTYSISKVCSERVARGFARRFGIDIYVLRIGGLIAPDEYKTDVFKAYVERPEEWKVHGWSYTDARDLGEMCERCVKVDGLGWQVFNATNDEITNMEGKTTEEFLRRMCPTTPFTRKMGEKEAPMSNRKIKEMLGFREEHNWRKYDEKDG
ncbi:NAD(P)-binding protein [Cadophora sp. DSE1049]|nr:NAD(P)-binding protein [Cadophora sp. DSE1049]